jgi:vancomycin resistance protein YoaR
VAVSLGVAFGVSYQANGAAFRFIHPPRDLVVGTRPAPAYGSLQRWLLGLPSESLLGEVSLFTGEEHRVMTAADLGFAVDRERTLKRIELATRSGHLLTRVERAFFPGPSRTVVAPALTFDEDLARRELFALAKEVNRAPVDAELDIEGHRRVEDVPGRELDIDATLRRLEAHSSEEESVEVAYREIPARVRSEDLLQIDVSRVLAVFETDFRKKAGRRALNIRRAAKLLNGHVIQPGETMSFNRVVGDRTESNGFVWAPVIVNDQMEPGIGGGVCQVATTLHAAAVLGGLSIEERRSHSRPSGYAPLGLDAAVIYGEVDLGIQNPYPHPVLVHAFLPSEFVIRVELLGAEHQSTVRHSYAVVQRHDFYRRLVENPALEAGQFERTQEGGFGYDIISTVETTTADGNQTVRRYSSKYYPVPEVYDIGPGTLESDLPELPDGALGLEPELSEEDGLATN